MKRSASGFVGSAYRHGILDIFTTLTEIIMLCFTSGLLAGIAIQYLCI